MKAAILAIAMIAGLFQQPDPAVTERTLQTVKNLPQVVYTLDVQGDFFSSHLQNKYSMLGMSTDGNLLISTGKDGITTEDPPQGQEPVPNLTTSWTDVQNVTHSVVTPVASPTAAGVQRAFELHQKLVELMQKAHPPKPI